MNTVTVAPGVTLGERSLVLIAGPCVIESSDHAVNLGGKIAEIAKRLKMPYIFKASFDKANRTSITSFRGPGLDDGLKTLERVKQTVGVPILTDIHDASQAAPAATVADVLQIPAFLSRQTDLIVAAARTGRVVNVKKGQFLAPEDMKNVVAKLAEVGCREVLLTERGASFGYHNLVVDMRALVTLRQFAPVCFDATHSVQRPGSQGDATGGDRTLAPPLARAAAAVGIDALFCEVHEDPEKALSDGPNSLTFAMWEALVEDVLKIRAALARE